MKILWMDTETGGFLPDKHSLLTISLAAYEDKKVIDVREWKVKHKEYCVTANAMSTNGIDLAKHDLEAQEKEEVLKEIKEFIKLHFGESRPYVGGHNVQFDVRFLSKFFKEHNEDWNKYVSHRTVDTCEVLRFLYAAEKIEKDIAGLDKAVEYFKITVDGRHTAKGDILATIKVYEHISNMINTYKEGE